MEQQEAQPGRLRRAVNDLVMAEMFLIQATLESASAIGDGVSELVDANGEGEESVAATLQRIRESALEPYTARYQFWRAMREGENPEKD